MQGDKVMKNGLWDNQEVKDLFSEIEKTKQNGLPLRKAFIMHAQKYSRQPNSVRNYYYHEIDNLERDDQRLKKLGIDLSKHKKNTIQYFSKDEEDSLMHKIDRLVGSGYSVRKACLTLSDVMLGRCSAIKISIETLKSKKSRHQGITS